MSATQQPFVGGKAESPADDTPDLERDDDADLFGDDDDDSDEDVTRHRPTRTLDDEDLDSGDDLGRDDRVAETVEDEDANQTGSRFLKIVPCEVPRINYPEGDEFYLLNMPNFMGIEQKAFDPDSYEVPYLPHDGDANRQTSTFSTAMSSIFWRYDPTDPSNLQSSARYVRWSDGSLTLQLATKPLEQYPVSALPMRQDFNRKLPPGTFYDPAKDSLTFLAAAHNTPVVDLQLIKPIDATMKIQSSGGATDDSELRLKQLLNASIEEYNPLVRVKELKEDPELARKAAEQFEKDRLRAQRKRENAEERLSMKRNNVLGRAGLGSSRMGGAGLSVAGLEDEMGMPTSRGKKKRTLRRNRHGEIYSDDEDETLPRGRTREDEYDREDDFLADSDEEPEQYDDDDGLDDEEEDAELQKDDADGDGRKTVLEDRSKQRERERTPKRGRADELDDEDAEGEPDDELLRQSPQQARKKRRVIDDEDEDE